MAVDLSTMLNLNALIAALLSVLMNVFAWRKKGYRGFRTISFSYIVFGAGLLVPSMVGNDPIPFASVLYTTFMAVGFFCMYEGIQRFRGLERRLLVFNLLLVVIMLLAMIFFTYVVPSLQYRIAGAALINLLQCGACCSALFRERKAEVELYQIIVAISFGVLALGLVLNLFMPFMTTPPREYLEAGLSLSFIYFFSAFFLLTSAFGFIWAVVEKSEAELMKLAKDLHDTLEDKIFINRELEKNNRFLDTLLDTIPIPVYHKDHKGVYLGVNEAFCKAVGRERETIKGRTVADIWHDSTVSWSEKTDHLVYETGRLQKHEGRVLYCDGLHHEVLESKNPLIDAEGRIIGIVGSITDITERKIHESKIRYLAHHDNLTGLHNRHYFYDQLSKAISKGKRSGSKVVLMFIDLDGFKEINDTYGHIAGDATLKSIGSRLQAITRDYDTVCRVGGDEFAFLLEEFVDREAAVSIAGKILKELSKPIPFKDYECSVSGSIGIAIFPQNTVSAEQLVTLADQAMYKAKSLGKDQYYFSEATPVEMSDGNKR